MSQIIGVQQNLLKRDDIYKDLEVVNCFKHNESIVNCLLNINRQSNYNKNLLGYVEYLIVYHNINLNINKIKKWNGEDFNKFKDITHKHFWHYRINLYKEGWIQIKEKKIKEKPPQNWGYSDPSINNYLNNVPYSIAHKALSIFNETDPNEIYSFIYSCNTIYDILEIKDIIFKEGSLLNKLFNIEESKGAGKGEALVPFLIKGRTLGSSSRYDVHLDNNSRVEIKSTSLSFRFGTKASIGNYEFYSNIIMARNVLLKLIEQLGLKTFKSLVRNNFYEISLLLIKEGDYTKEHDALSTAIDSCEISQKRFDLINLWFYMARVETFNYFYEYAIKQDIFTKHYEVYDNDKLKLINVLKSLKYVKDPMSLITDINEEIKKCFQGIDYLVIFKEKEKDISICTSPDEIMLSCISQNGIKVIERNGNVKEDMLKQSFLMWLENTDEEFYDMYMSIKTKGEVLTLC